MNIYLKKNNWCQSVILLQLIMEYILYHEIIEPENVIEYSGIRNFRNTKGNYEVKNTEAFL